MKILYKNGELFKIGKETSIGYIEKSNGYKRFTLNGKKYYYHRFIWELHFGNIPEGFEIDHINRDRLDNKIENLRLVSHQDNNKNKGLNTNNKSGFKGVCWDKRSQKWYSYIMIDGKHKYLGLFENIQDANSARLEANKLYGFID